MRLFISIPLPKPVKSALAKIKHDFPKLPAKWVEEENLHITLIFVGETGEAGATKVSEVMDTTTWKLRPIDLHTGKLVLLPNDKKAHVLAVELEGKTEKLVELSNDIKKGLAGKKISFDKKPFRSHITLARIKRLKAGERRAFRGTVKNYSLPKLEFEAEQIELIESQLTPKGPIYKTIGTAGLCRRC